MTPIEVLQGDITKLDVDIIVNAANKDLIGGGGVDGAIHRAGGPEIAEACKAIREKSGGCPTGQAVITPAGRLKSKFVVHAVGPVWHGGGHEERELLSSAYRSSLALALSNSAASIAFPNISTGVYGFPKEEAATIAIDAVGKFVKQHVATMRIVFCCFDEENYRIYKKLLP